MTNLERLIKAHTQATTVITLSAATQRWAEELAREEANDPEFRAEMRALIRKHFGTTMRRLARKQNGRRGPSRKRPSPKRSSR